MNNETKLPALSDDGVGSKEAGSIQECICEGEFPEHCGPECDCFHHLLTSRQLDSTCNHDPACGCDICNRIRVVERASLDKDKTEDWCHYHNGPFKEVCPLGGKCERKEDWGKSVEPAAPVVQLVDGAKTLESAMAYLNEQNPKNWEAVEILNKSWGKYAKEYFSPAKPTPVVVPDDESEDLYFFEAGPDGAHSEVLPESKLKQTVHDSMCMCGMDWQLCGSDGLTTTCELLSDDSEWNSASDIKRWSWGQDFEDGYIRIVRLLTTQPAPVAPVVVRPEETPKRVQVALERFGWRFKIADDAKAMEFAWNELMDVWDHHSLTAQPAPLPSDQKETFEQWRLSTHPHASAVVRIFMEESWNAAKGTK